MRDGVGRSKWGVPMRENGVGFARLTCGVLGGRSTSRWGVPVIVVLESIRDADERLTCGVLDGRLRWGGRSRWGVLVVLESMRDERGSRLIASKGWIWIWMV